MNGYNFFNQIALNLFDISSGVSDWYLSFLYHLIYFNLNVSLKYYLTRK